MTVEKSSGAAANGPVEDVLVITGYIGNPKRNEYMEIAGNYRAIREITDLPGEYVEIKQGALAHSDVQGPFVSPQMKIAPNRNLEVALEDLNWALKSTMYLSREDLQYAELTINGTKNGEKLVAKKLLATPCRTENNRNASKRSDIH